MTAAYEVRDLVCRLGGRAIVRGVDLDVRHGEVLALVGPNGAGKSTLLGALTGDVPIAEGEVRLDGRPLGDWSAGDLARTRAVLLQANQVSFPFTVREVVEMGRNPWTGHASAADDDAAIAEAIDRSDVAHLLDRPFTALSGGEKARASLARVLAQRTDVVLLDEPTAALDLRHQEEVMVVARDLAATGRAVVVVLHDLSLAAARADRIAMVHDGRIVSVGTPAEVLTPERVEEVYGIGVHVLPAPDGHLIVVPHRGLSDTVSP
ncbi:heme ABC transporter ATP-binding protein [Aeromicrobium tamlense]|uniref:Heme ABC transporter ATP-binding protein n=1 Tax=Aeromicrobium tamlense TaxID=375541 RepID=A0A8I0KN31_9ACTN|nr:heme ABC transporter ATP-binding protein [Aeromicrobium tamlense]MBD1271808.1 heme ABC transporter ATP-binding protein [Aeromicrobium tamlense]NYI39004.1 iron complex transport system ATP-binding protein [Aeromicrobium tamlense]